MKAPTSSIRKQLLIWLLVPILVLWMIGASVTYGLAIAFATDAYDQSLLDSVHSIASRIVVKEGKIVVDLPPIALDILKDNLKDRLYYKVVDRHGHAIAGDAEFEPGEFGQREEEDSRIPDFHYSRLDGEEVRVASVFYSAPSSAGEPVNIMVAQTLHGREQLADEILIGVVLPQLIIVLLSGLVVWIGVRRGLAPLDSLRDAVASRTPLDLRPISEEEAPREVLPLVAAINGFIERLRYDMEGQRRFVANAAHQLRTPIAGLKTQAELALRQSDPEDVRHALGLIHLGAERAARLTNQLLTLARSEPGVVDVAKFQPLNLCSAARGAVKELASLAVEKGIDLGFESDATEVVVLGDPVSLHELASNLIENAVRYSHEGGTVTVRIVTAGSQSTGSGDPLIEEVGPASVALIVEDDGPGIPECERQHVFERFYRLESRGGRQSGSGLGLSIVREIASAHRARVGLSSGRDGKGTAVAVVFELAEPSLCLLDREAAEGDVPAGIV